jgi:signal transduction histidine kinase
MRPLRRRTARLRLTMLYGLLFLFTGALLLAITGAVTFQSASATHEAAKSVNQAGNRASQATQAALAQAQARIQQLQHQLTIQQDQAQQSLWHALLVGGVVALCIMVVVSILLGWLVANRVLGPLRTMTAATRRISADNLHQRLAVPGPVDEVKHLADTIDELLERLEGAFAAQRRFVANASHELRTPLATMRAWIDVTMAKPEPAPPQTTALAGRIRTELDQIDGMLEGLLALARAQHGDLPGRTVLSLDAAVSAALAARSEDINDKALTVQVHTHPTGAWIHGSPALIFRMVGNVLDNAVTHNEHGGWITVRTEVTGPEAHLIVETGGAVLDPEQVRQLAQPFRRLGADRTGSASGAGLGLSIVAAIAEAHGGRLDLRARERGGLRVDITLPLAETVIQA